MKNVTPEFIRDIFYSGQFGFVGDIEVTSKIAFLVNHDYLLMSKVSIVTKEHYLSICSDSELIDKSYEAAGGSSEHIALKLLAQRYLHEEYSIESVCEHPFVGYYPDVQSCDKHIICECGHTKNPEKIFSYFQDPIVRYVIQIPYPNDGDAFIFGYEFQASSNLVPFLALESQGISQSIKDILNRR